MNHKEFDFNCRAELVFLGTGLCNPVVAFALLWLCCHFVFVKIHNMASYFLTV